jgi:putative ABC transport system permease protein
LVSLLAGSYPAFFLSAFRPIAVLKGTNPSASGLSGLGRGGLRSSLVVFQFLVSISLIIATTVVYQQLQYIQTIRLGYDKEQVLVLEGTGALGRNEAVFRRQLAQDSRVANASVSAFLPNDRYNTGMIAMQPDRNDAQMTRMTWFGVDPHYLPTLGMKLAAGRNFSTSVRSDSTGVIINETAARLFGWTKNVIGRTLTRPDVANSGNNARTYRVIGVVKDFHFRSLHERIAPAVMTLSDNAGLIIVKTRTADIAGLLTSLKTRWAALGTEEPFRYSFLDDAYQASYDAELKTSRILALFAGLTVFVACLGLFGLATFTAEQRTKEIGVRKVLGASVTSIVTLLSQDFLKLVLIAIVIASPIAWYAMHRWLQSFAYRIDIAWWVFGLAGLLAVGIALLTVSFQSIKAALMNPVKSLRSE